MIAKNESGIINKAISSIRGVTTDVVVVDTGSSDDTVELCGDLGCTVITGADSMNKAESRNKAIDAAKGEWVVILDADEIVTDPRGLAVGIDLISAVGIAGGSINAGCSMGSGGVPTEVFHQMRVWEKDAYRYKYRAHELPVLQKGANDRTAVVDVLFAHYPNRSYDHTAWKLQYTLDRLLLDVKDDPAAARPRYYLGRQHVYMGEYDKAIVELGKFLEMTKVVGHWDRPNACLDTYKAYIEKSNLEEDNTKKQALLKESVRWLYNACLENPTNRKWWLELAIRYYDLGKFDLVIGILSLMYSLPVEDQWGYRSTACESDVPLDLMSRAFWKVGNYTDGYSCAKKALELAPDDKRLEENLRFFTDKLDEIKKEALDKESKIVYN